MLSGPVTNPSNLKNDFKESNITEKEVKSDVINDDNSEARYSNEDVTANTKFEEKSICEKMRIPLLKILFDKPDFEENNLGDHSEVSTSDIHEKYDGKHCIDKIEDEPMQFVLDKEALSDDEEMESRNIVDSTVQKICQWKQESLMMFLF